MATTTNYSWTTPDDTDLVKDGAAAIRTLGSSIDTTTKALNPSTTLGDIEYRSSTANTNTRLALGTAGQVLTVNSGATAPEWAAVATGGMTLISTTTLTGASVTLSAIPATFNSLEIIVRLHLTATDNQALLMRMNSDTTINRHAFRQDATATNNIAFDRTSFEVSGQIDNTITQAIVKISIPDYANTSTWKCCQMLAFTNNASTTTNFNFFAGSGVYNQTAAISSLVFLPNSGNFTSGTVLLYGVK
jgi:hypothetical protein